MQNQTTHAGRGGSKTCLIIEDSQFDQQRLTRVLETAHSDLNVAIATTLDEARQKLRLGGISLILLDNNLPDGFGANFALELAADPVLSLIPVVLVSDWPSPFMWDKAASAGVLHVVNKTEFEASYVQSALNAPKRRSPALN